MSRTAESLQVVWQKKFQEEYKLNPFLATKDTLVYTKLDNPATWWHNPVNPNSLRLTQNSYQVLIKSKVKSYKFELKDKIKPKAFVQLERYFTSPYYILNARRLVVFGEVESMMLALHAGDLHQYLDNQDK